MSEARRPLALLITPVLPGPTGSGRALRAWDWLQELARDHDLQVLVAARRDSGDAIPSDYPATVHFIGPELLPTRGIGRRIGKLFPLAALLSRRVVADWTVPSASFAPFLEKLFGVPNDRVRQIVVFRFYLWDVGRAVHTLFPRAAVHLDLDDVESSARWSIALACWRARQWIRGLDYLATAVQYWIAERTVAADTSTIMVAASDDIPTVPRRFGTALCRANRMPLPAAVKVADGEGVRRVLFVGTLNYPPNEEAVRFLVTRLQPLLGADQSQPGYRITVIGRHASPAVRRLLNSSAGIDYLSDVRDLAPWYARSAAVLIPLWAGGGTKFKTIEAFAHARPVVSTRHGMRGLNAVDGESYLCAEDAASFVSAIRTLDTQPQFAAKLAREGHALFKMHNCASGEAAGSAVVVSGEQSR